MPTELSGNAVNGHDASGHNGDRPLLIADGDALGPEYRLWRRLQHGQEKITRFGRFMDRYGKQLRHQNGHDHRASVCFLFDDMIIRMNQHLEELGLRKLDEVLIIRCINHHDEPEGVLQVDVPANIKTNKDDLREYLVFEEMYKSLKPKVWEVMQQAFLLQFCLDNPVCFPEDAREVMSWLAIYRRHEALFFQGVQMLDYLFYAYECFAEHSIGDVMDEVGSNQIRGLDMIAEQLPGFREVVWTDECKLLFQQQHFTLIE